MRRIPFAILSLCFFAVLSSSAPSFRPTGRPAPFRLPSAHGPVSSQLSFNAAAAASSPQGLGPTAIAPTQDGQYAYISFSLSESIFKIRLSDLSVVATADLSAYFPVECTTMVLDTTEKKLFAYCPTWQKMLVLSTETMSLIRVIDDYRLIGMLRSQFGLRIITWEGGYSVKVLDTETYAVTDFSDFGLGFVSKIREHPTNPNLWYVVAAVTTGGSAPWKVGLYDQAARAWTMFALAPRQQDGEAPGAFLVLPAGNKAYLATMGGWYPDYHAYGWLHAVDLASLRVKAIPIDGAAGCLESDRAGTRLFVGTGWPVPKSNNVLIVDTASDGILGTIPLGTNKFGWSFTQMDDLRRDPVRDNYLYGTSADGNAFLKMDISVPSLIGTLVLNNEAVSPHFFVRRPGQPFGNILIRKSAKSFELSLETAAIQKQVSFPLVRQDMNSYDIGVLSSGNLLIAQGSSFLEVNAATMQVVATRSLPAGTPAISNFTLSGDRTRIYSVAYSGNLANIFLAVNSATFQVEKQMSLTGGGFEFRPFELPGGSKVYALGGLQNGAVVVHVINASGYAIQKTLTYSQAGNLGITTGPNAPYAYDPGSHTLFVGATYVVLAIDTLTDEIKKVIDLRGAAAAIGLNPAQVTLINAVGLAYVPAQNALFIAHLDRSFVSIYDLTSDRFASKVIPLQGYFPSFMFSNDAVSKIYCLNFRSDSISVIDVASRTLEKAMVLDDYVINVYPPMQLTGRKYLNRSLSQAEYINVLTWASNPANLDVAAYRIYAREGTVQALVGEVKSTVFAMEIRKVEADKSYVYAVTAVASDGTESESAIVTIK
jgi:DNA-binding beta-propeller fold protein YncE